MHMSLAILLYLRLLKLSQKKGNAQTVFYRTNNDREVITMKNIVFRVQKSTNKRYMSQLVEFVFYPPGSGLQERIKKHSCVIIMLTQLQLKQ